MWVPWPHLQQHLPLLCSHITAAGLPGTVSWLIAPRRGIAGPCLATEAPLGLHHPRLLAPAPVQTEAWWAACAVLCKNNVCFQRHYRHEGRQSRLYAPARAQAQAQLAVSAMLS